MNTKPLSLCLVNLELHKTWGPEKQHTWPLTISPNLQQTHSDEVRTRSTEVEITLEVSLPTPNPHCLPMPWVTYFTGRDGSGWASVYVCIYNHFMFEIGITTRVLFMWFPQKKCLKSLKQWIWVIPASINPTTMFIPHPWPFLLQHLVHSYLPLMATIQGHLFACVCHKCVLNLKLNVKRLFTITDTQLMQAKMRERERDIERRKGRKGDTVHSL